jgi:DNA-directed RNA polymerase specialized sigma24 family protein
MQRSQSRQIARTKRDKAHQQDFALAVEDHRPQIFRFLLASLRDVDTAETLTQECFSRLIATGLVSVATRVRQLG